ncbi:MAG: hypothetical protein WAP52_01275 [Candidatus Sungiibacteriota bacterium]
MPLPTRIITLAVNFAVKTGIAALKSGTITSKFSATKFGEYAVEAKRRWTVGEDGAVSTIIRISKNGVTQEVWHIVSKGLRILNKHRK